MDKFIEIIIKIMNKPFHLIGFGLAFYVADYYGKMFLIIGFISIGLGFGELAERLYEFFKSKCKDYCYKKELFNRLTSLNFSEKTFLYNAFLSNSQTSYLQTYEDISVMTGLHNKNIVIINGFEGNKNIDCPELLINTPIMVSDLTWQLLKKHSKKLFPANSH